MPQSKFSTLMGVVNCFEGLIVTEIIFETLIKINTDFSYMFMVEVNFDAINE